MDKLVFIQNGSIPVTSSRIVAEYFDKRHSHVLDVVKNLINDLQNIEENASEQPEPKNRLSLTQRYFIKDSYVDSTGKKNRQYLLTQDGFTLAVMGFTGKKALKVKLAFIEQFNQMKAELERLHSQAVADDYATKQRIAYLSYLPSFHNNMHGISDFVNYAVRDFGVDRQQLEDHIYRLINGSINKALKIPKGHRPDANPETAVHLKHIHRKANDAIIDGINHRSNPFIIIENAKTVIVNYGKDFIDYQPHSLVSKG